jgi:hypothetical protein
MKKFKGLFIFVAAISLSLISKSAALAEGYLYFEKTTFNNVNVGDTIPMKIVVNTGGAEVVKIKTVLKYNPSLLKLDTNSINANGNMQCNWPDDQNVNDQQNGVLMFTADCSTSPYKSSGTADDGLGDYFITFDFKALSAGTASVDWLYSGTDDGQSTVLMENQSPPQNILLSAPDSATIVIGGGSNTNPNTGLFDQSPYLIAGFLGIGGIIVGYGISNLHLKHSQESTLVLIDNDTK